MSASIATTAAEVLILFFFVFVFFSRKGYLVGVGVGGDSTGTQAPAKQSGWLLR